MKINKKYSQKVIDLLKDPAARRTWEEEGVLGAFSLGIEQVLDSRNLSQADLARMLGKKPQAISRAMKGGQNLSVRTMIEMAFALNHTIKLEFQALENLEEATVVPRSLSTPLANYNYKATLPKISHMRPSESPAITPCSTGGIQ